MVGYSVLGYTLLYLLLSNTQHTYPGDQELSGKPILGVDPVSKQTNECVYVKVRVL